MWARGWGSASRSWAGVVHRPLTEGIAEPGGRDMQVSCRHCGEPYDIDERSLPRFGASVRCPACGGLFELPARSSQAARRYEPRPMMPGLAPFAPPPEPPAEAPARPAPPARNPVAAPPPPAAATPPEDVQAPPAAAESADPPVVEAAAGSDHDSLESGNGDLANEAASMAPPDELGQTLELPTAPEEGPAAERAAADAAAADATPRAVSEVPPSPPPASAPADPIPAPAPVAGAPEPPRPDPAAVARRIVARLAERNASRIENALPQGEFLSTLGFEVAQAWDEFRLEVPEELAGRHFQNALNERFFGGRRVF